MVETILNSSWSMSLTSVPTYGMAIVSAPVVSFLAIKVALLAKASAQKKQREWVFTEERDADGMPILATAKVRSVRASGLRAR
jgi:hypothetical protein